MSTPDPAAATVPAPAPAAAATAAPAPPAVSHQAAIPLPITRASVASVAAAAAVCAVVVWYFAGRAGANVAPLAFSRDGIQNLGTVLAPLIAIALFIERCTEVVISTWRDDGAMVRQHAVAHATGESVKFAQLELRRYKHLTQRYSFLVSLTLSLVAGLVGVRGVASLMDAVPGDAAQRDALAMFDILVTGLLLAGGADGIHQIVTTFTGFLDSSKAKMAPPAAPPAP